jgi:hypothetical protein
MARVERVMTCYSCRECELGDGTRSVVEFRVRVCVSGDNSPN